MPRVSMKDALRIALKAAAPKQVQMLSVHFASKAGKTTARSLAEAVGYKAPQGASMQYGLFAKKVADLVGSRATEHHIQVLADIKGDRDSKGESILTLRPEVREALKALGW